MNSQELFEITRTLRNLARERGDGLGESPVRQFMTNQQKIDDYFDHSAGKTRGRIPHELVLRWLDEKDAEKLLLARLSAKTPQFFNPLDAMAAEKLRDDILSNDQGERPMEAKENL